MKAAGRSSFFLDEGINASVEALLSLATAAKPSGKPTLVNGTGKQGHTQSAEMQSHDTVFILFDFVSLFLKSTSLA